VLWIGALPGWTLSSELVEDFGAVGDGVTYSHVAIQEAINAAGVGGTVYFTSNMVYNLGQRLIAMSGQTWLGFGATLRRCDSIQTRLTEDAPIGSKTLKVADGSLFEVGMEITPIRGPGMGDGEAPFDVEHKIVGIDGNVLTMMYELGQSYSAGDLVVTIHPLVELPAESEGIKVQALRFDGNYDKNNFHHAWQIGQLIVFRGVGNTVENCSFENSWGDAINLGGVNSRIVGNRFTGAGGAAIHLSSASLMSISNNYFADLCRASALALHTEGAVTVSQENHGILLSHNTFTNINGLMVGYIDPTGNRDMTIEHNEAIDCKGLSDIIFYHEDFMPGFGRSVNVVFRHNRASNVGLTWVRNYLDSKLEQITFSDNVIANGYLIVEGVSGASVINNTFTMVSPEIYGDNTTSPSESAGLVTLRSCDNVRVAGNTLVGGLKGMVIQNWSAVAISNVVVTGNTVHGAEIHALEVGERVRLREDTSRSDFRGLTIDGNTFRSSNSGPTDNLGWLGRKVAFSNNYLESLAGGLEVLGGGALLSDHTRVFGNTFFVATQPLLIPLPATLTNLTIVSNVWSSALQAAFYEDSGSVIQANSGLLRDLPTQSIHAGVQLSLSLSPGHILSPPGTLHYSLQSPVPDGLSLDASRGVLSWLPGPDQSGTTNVISVTIEHAEFPDELNLTRSFTIVVRPEIRLEPRVLPDGRLRVTVSGNEGVPFLVQVSTNLIDWSTLSSAELETSSDSFIDLNPERLPVRFYRILVSP
jgi:hypothetical protein